MPVWKKATLRGTCALILGKKSLFAFLRAVTIGARGRITLRYMRAIILENGLMSAISRAAITLVYKKSTLCGTCAHTRENAHTFAFTKDVDPLSINLLIFADMSAVYTLILA